MLPSPSLCLVLPHLSFLFPSFPSSTYASFYLSVPLPCFFPNLLFYFFFSLPFLLLHTLPSPSVSFFPSFPTSFLHFLLQHMLPSTSPCLIFSLLSYLFLCLHSYAHASLSPFGLFPFLPPFLPHSFPSFLPICFSCPSP